MPHWLTDCSWKHIWSLFIYLFIIYYNLLFGWKVRFDRKKFIAATVKTCLRLFFFKVTIVMQDVKFICYIYLNYITLKNIRFVSTIRCLLGNLGCTCQIPKTFIRSAISNHIQCTTIRRDIYKLKFHVTTTCQLRLIY